MRKLHKKQILELLKTLDKATDEVKRLLANKQMPSAINLLADCQDSAANIGEFINQAQSQGTKSVQLLTEFSEMLYKASTEISSNNSNSSFASQLKKQLISIKDCINNELKANKIEVVFFPYKASMWDSLESIYLAAKDDPDCDAFVVPIPYYDKINGKHTEMHWETDYPKNIPLFDYKKYNIEERHPDIIFIHNPYDDLNIVTSVHPAFYCERLRNLTDCLVYVPYFVADGKTIQEHFCTMPGCIFAHKVIAQTEEERKIYVKTYKEFARRYKVPESLDKIESKFLALGNPKLDKAATAKIEDYEIPGEWEKLINNEDGSRKKVVFYNTSIGTLLENSVEDNKPSNKYLQKIKSVFEFFKKQNDAVLLWRPHPLLESTIKSMRPWLLQEYAEIVNEYKSSGYGIYDDSQNLNRAIALSDIYYGDGSSVGKLFRSAGKPVALQIFCEIWTSKINIFYYDIDYIWFMNSYNTFYRYNKQSKKTECMGIIDGQKNNGYMGAAINDKKFYFAPYKANKISIFDMNKKCFEQIVFKDNFKYLNNFNKIIRFKHFVYFIPLEFSAIMRINANTNEIEYFSQWTDEVLKLRVSKSQDDENLIFRGFCVAGKEIAVIINEANSVMFFNMETSNYEILNIEEKFEQGGAICFDGQDYYICPLYEGYIIKWNRDTKKALKIKFPISFSRKKGKRVNFIIKYLNGYVWLFPCAANKAYRINTNTNEVEEIPELIKYFENVNLKWYYNRANINKNFIYASTINKGIVQFDTNTSELNFIKPNLEIEPRLFSCLNDYDKWKTELSKAMPENEIFGRKIWESAKGGLR